MAGLYWNNKGKFQDFANQLNTRIPAEGSVANPRSSNKALELFRRAGNAYYDVFNNGAMNRAGDVQRIFGVGISQFRRQGYTASGRGYRTIDFDRIAPYLDRVMDSIVLKAAIEQGLVTQAEVDARALLETMSTDVRIALFRILEEGGF